jgi:hypothetical protein
MKGVWSVQRVKPALSQWWNKSFSHRVIRWAGRAAFGPGRIPVSLVGRSSWVAFRG